MNDSTSINNRKIKILIVDDEDIVLSIARDTLEDSGYEVETANSGEEAAEMLQQSFYDFMLSDIRMPGMNGLELGIKAREIIPSIGIIFMTGYANLNTAKDAIKSGALDYIMKPFEIKELRNAVKNAIRKKFKDTEKTLSNELTRLSDLNQLMYAVNDRHSLMRMSLGFAMMQANTTRGSIIFKSDRDQKVEIISSDDSGNRPEVQSYKCSDIFNEKAPDFLNAPIVFESIEQHPLYSLHPEKDLEKILLPKWHDENTKQVQIALKRGDNLYGFLSLGYPTDKKELKESDLKFLTITSSQITISLENIVLLEESQKAYARLKDLQDQTLQLERMATKGQMSAEIGHELNNFLGVIFGNLSLMRHQITEKGYNELTKYIDVVDKNLDNIKKFTDGLIDFAKLQSKFEECMICDLIGDVIDQLKAQSRFNNIKIFYEKPATKIRTMADRGQIQQLLYNLVNNSGDAINDADDGRSGEIRISLDKTDDGSKYKLMVRDNGIGFEIEKEEMAYQKRFTTKETGHGFGLIVCQRIIENHSGEINLDSTPGVGTTTDILFPIKNPIVETQEVS